MSVLYNRVGLMVQQQREVPIKYSSSLSKLLGTVKKGMALSETARRNQKWYGTLNDSMWVSGERVAWNRAMVVRYGPSAVVIHQWALGSFEVAGRTRGWKGAGLMLIYVEIMDGLVGWELVVVQGGDVGEGRVRKADAQGQRTVQSSAAAVSLSVQAGRTVRR
jgi:hypothetical protein